MSYVQNFAGIANLGLEVKILSGQTESAAISTAGATLCGVIVPAAFTGTVLTFLVCNTVDGTYLPLKTTSAGTALSQTVAPGAYYALDPKDFQGVGFLKIKSGTTEAADRTLIVSLKGF